MNRPKQIGTAAESALVKAARQDGFGQAERRALGGSKDLGDILLCPGVIIEVKAGKQTENPSDGQVAAWWAETRAEAVHAAADVALLVLRRRGKGDPLAWWCWMDLRQLLHLTSVGIMPDERTSTVLIRASVADALRMLRAAGWGDPLDA
ncbi:hypothetical protein [Micropruina sp.]|uniref:hypothetical protein n=1 Tax=Micropruina sp. TaxID=2737536 RepID=UPI0039E2E863